MVDHATAYAAEDIRAEFPAQSATPKRAQPLPDTISEGGRHEMLTSLAGSMRQRNAGEEAIAAALHAANESQCSPPLPDREVDAIARWSGRAETGGGESDALDPLAMARRVRATFPGLVRWQDQFWAWRNGAYQPVGTDTVRAAVYQTLEHEGRRAAATQAVVSNVLDALRSVALLDEHVAPPCYLTNGARLPAGHVVLSSGVLNLMSGEHWEGSADLFTLSALPVDYDPNADCPEWRHFLESLWPDDEQSIATLQELFGYLVSGDTDHEKIFLLVGPKRSGKGTILRVLTALLGRDNVASPTLASLQGQFGLQPLIGTLAATVTDARLSGRADQDAIAERLLSISGEDHVSVPRKFLPDYTAQLQSRFVLASNELPRLHDSSGALASRFVPLVLQHSWFGHEDRNLSRRLYDELPGILNWAIEGYRRLSERGAFVVPESAADDLRDLEDLASPVGAFVRDVCETEPGAEVPCGDLYQRWCRWCEQHGRTHPGTAQSFSRDLRAAVPGITVTQRRRGGIRERVFCGVRLSRDGTAIPGTRPEEGGY